MKTWGYLSLFLASVSLLSAQGQKPSAEAGRFRSYVFHRPQIEETYRIEREGESLVLKSKPVWLHHEIPPEVAAPLPETNLRIIAWLAPVQAPVLAGALAQAASADR
jgi:hypothetical protein